MIRKTYLPGSTIFFEGQLADCAYMVERGQVEICAVRERTHITLAMLGPGEIFGEMAVLDDGVRSAQARAVEETEVLIIRTEQLRRHIMEAEPIVGQVLGSLIKRFRQAQTGLLNDLPSRMGASHVVVPNITDPDDANAGACGEVWTGSAVNTTLSAASAPVSSRPSSSRS